MVVVVSHMCNLLTINAASTTAQSACNGGFSADSSGHSDSPISHQWSAPNEAH